MFHQEQVGVHCAPSTLNIGDSILETTRTGLNRLQGYVLEDARFNDSKDLGEDSQDTSHWRKPRFVDLQLPLDRVFLGR